MMQFDEGELGSIRMTIDACAAVPRTFSATD